MNDAFGYWLAGFMDGESCFTIYRNPGFGNREHGSWSCMMSLSLRDDDSRLIRRIHQLTKIGDLLERPSQARAQPQLEWRVRRKADCFRLIEILDRYPLQSKKAKDYDLWRQAMMLRKESKRNDQARDERIAQLREELIEGRKYPGEPLVTHYLRNSL